MSLDSFRAFTTTNYIIQHGKVIHHSNSLRGIRKYAATHIAEYIHLYRYQDGSALLSVQFENYATGRVAFASFEVLKDMVARWKNVRGVPVIRHFQPSPLACDGFI